MENSRWFQLFLLAIFLPLTWKLCIYVLSPFQFVSDTYGNIRFILFCVLVYCYFKPDSQHGFLKNVLCLILFFLVYDFTIYAFDLLIHFVFNKHLKLDYLSHLYEIYRNDGSEEELKAMGKQYKMSSREEMLLFNLKRLFSAEFYLRSFLYDMIRYMVVSFVLAKIYIKREENTGN